MPEGISSTKIIARLNQVNLLFVGSDLLIFFLRNRLLPGKVPLYYSRPWGEEQLAPKEWLLIIPFLSLVIFLINWQTNRIFLKKSENFLPFFISSFSLLFSGLGAITLWKIIFLVT